LAPDVRLFYATRDGQARRIAERIQARLANSAIATDPVDLAGRSSGDLSTAALVVLVASVRYGRHLGEATCFLSTYQALPSRPPLVLVSVNLTARKPGKDSPEGNPYLRKLISRYGLAPVLAVAIAGRLDYASYRWWDRHIIRLIMGLTGGPTDPTTCIDYASPAAIDDVAAHVVRLYRGLAPRPASVMAGQATVSRARWPGQP
jgi:menaquinone-dependent protoporphyrinogen oxidase